MMSAPHLTPIKSSMASHAAYDPASQTLTVRFKNGSEFKYNEVPHNIGEVVLQAKSFGSSFNRHVAGKYKATKL